MRTQAATALNTPSTPVEVSFDKDHISSDVLSALVEVNFDEIYIAHKMNESPDGSLYHVIYECLFAERPSERHPLNSSGVSNQ